MLLPTQYLSLIMVNYQLAGSRILLPCVYLRFRVDDVGEGQMGKDREKKHDDGGHDGIVGDA
jgi:hypothetical protein